jgi:hypothetical protein
MAAKKKHTATKPRSSSITAPRLEVAQRVDYAGVRIINPPSTKLPRLVPGGEKRKVGGRAKLAPVAMDLRGFVPSRPSSVVSAFIGRELERARDEHPLLGDALASRKQASWFDAVAHFVADIVFERIAYETREGAAWQLPEETLELGRGDCEDRATLLASSLIAAGISPYNVRVALGTIVVKGGRSGTKVKPHAWVVYRSEHGGWAALEPVPKRSNPRFANLRFGYEPELVFNGEHLWSVNALEKPSLRKRWNALESTFHGEVHQCIIADAASRTSLPPPVRTRLSRTFTELFSNQIDEPDLGRYDPRHHFDSGLFAPAWGHVMGWTRAFHRKPLTDSEGVRAMCWAAHAIADFYAHSSYAHFVQKERGAPIPYDPETKRPALAYDYPNDPEYRAARFTHFNAWYQPILFDRLTRWKGGPISGRYALKGDKHAFIESLVNTAPMEAFPSAASRALAGSLPHHDELAVDHEHGSNKLYGAKRYAQQYFVRYALAVRHITAVLQRHPEL